MRVKYTHGGERGNTAFFFSSSSLCLLQGETPWADTQQHHHKDEQKMRGGSLRGREEDSRFITPKRLRFFFFSPISHIPIGTWIGTKSIHHHAGLNLINHKASISSKDSPGAPIFIDGWWHLTSWTVSIQRKSIFPFFFLTLETSGGDGRQDT